MLHDIDKLLAARNCTSNKPPKTSDSNSRRRKNKFMSASPPNNRGSILQVQPDFVVRNVDNDGSSPEYLDSDRVIPSIDFQNKAPSYNTK